MGRMTRAEATGLTIGLKEILAIRYMRRYEELPNILDPIARYVIRRIARGMSYNIDHIIKLGIIKQRDIDYILMRRKVKGVTWH